VHEVFGDPAPAMEPEPTPRVVEFEGNAPVATLTETFSGTIAGREAETVGGLLVQALGRIPRPGERFLLHGLEFDVLAASVTRVERVVVRRGPVRAVALDGSEAGL
jgi:CBS domain containing-hemolysin-like protein